MTEQPGHILDPDVIAELHAGPPQVEVLEAVEVHRRYGSHEVLRGVSFGIRRGEVKAILGPSGSGKSTLLRCLALLEPLDGGEIRMEGRRLGVREGDGRPARLPEAELARQRTDIGMVFQRFNLFPHLTALGNVMLGLRKVRYAASGAAPIAPEVLRFFMGLGLPMHEVYGMTENTAVATGNRPGRVKLGTVGEPQVGVELRVDEETGEILTRHPGVFVGYFRDPEATARVKTADGWLHTGDIGEWVDGTHVRITDRAKDIIITSGGKNVAPSEIENALKASPYIKEAIVVGDRRPYLVALIGIELETVGDWAQRRGIAYTTYRDLSDRPEVLDLVRGVIDDVNSRFARSEQVKKFRMLPKELDHEDGELTATQKVKRSAVAKIFAELVDEMYGSA